VPRRIIFGGGSVPTTTIDTIASADGNRSLERMRSGLVPNWWSKPLKELKLATFQTRALKQSPPSRSFEVHSSVRDV
jgi:putative SOS response-associated peptidase YedK